MTRKARLSISSVFVLCILSASLLLLIIFGLERVQSLLGQASGSAWSTPLDLSGSYGMDPEIAFDKKNNIVHVVYNESSNLVHRYSTDNGITWSTPTKFASTPGTNPEWQHIVIDSDGNAHVVYRKYSDGDWYTKWTKATNSWSQPTAIPGFDNGHPRIIITADDTIHLFVMGGGSINYATKPKAGNWSSKQALTSDGSWFGLATNGTDVAIAWVIDSNKNIVLKELTPSGWDATQTIATNVGNGGNPRLTYDSNGTIHAIWSQNSTLKYANDHNWANILTIAGFSLPGDVATDEFGTVHALWTDNNTHLTGYAYRDSQTNQWLVTTNVFQEGRASGNVGTAARLRYWNGNLYAVYAANNNTGSPHVYLSVKSTTGSPPTSSTTPSPAASASSSPSPTSSSTASPTPKLSSSPSPSPLAGDCPASQKAVCWDCNHDNSINILDFSCFIKYYGQSY